MKKRIIKTSLTLSLLFSSPAFSQAELMGSEIREIGQVFMVTGLGLGGLGAGTGLWMYKHVFPESSKHLVTDLEFHLKKYLGKKYSYSDLKKMAQNKRLREEDMDYLSRHYSNETIQEGENLTRLLSNAATTSFVTGALTYADGTMYYPLLAGAAFGAWAFVETGVWLHNQRVNINKSRCREAFQIVPGTVSQSSK